jgi:predicted transcriptional regulator
MKSKELPPYHATPEELQAIDEGLEAIRRGEIATEEEVEAVFAKFRRSGAQ